MNDMEQQLFSVIERLQERWSDTLEIAFNGVIGMREQLKELTAQVEVLTQEVRALRQEVRKRREDRHLFPKEESL